MSGAASQCRKQSGDFAPLLENSCHSQTDPKMVISTELEADKAKVAALRRDNGRSN
jgi:hypothetical protein